MISTTDKLAMCLASKQLHNCTIAQGLRSSLIKVMYTCFALNSVGRLEKLRPIFYIKVLMYTPAAGLCRRHEQKREGVQPGMWQRALRRSALLTCLMLQQILGCQSCGRPHLSRPCSL